MAVRGVTAVPWSEAMRWSHARRTAALICAGEAEGARWDHRGWRWLPPPENGR